MARVFTIHPELWRENSLFTPSYGVRIHPEQWWAYSPRAMAYPELWREYTIHPELGREFSPRAIAEYSPKHME